MAIDFKYRIHEVAKDFGLTSKVVGQILTDYVAAPKNHMQVLEDQELSVIVEYLTQKNPVSGIEVIFAEVAKEEKPQQAEVLAVGPGGVVDGKEVKMEVKVGDNVIYSKYSGTEVKLDDEEYIIVKQSDILAIIQ